ncbi:hypothetical protein [Streptomyces sp. I05A-00742]|uniref:hypothetical protein n=1 Tax=Streptomyces sp. I05A-00742 TaxID=2732853 RepID=UPI001488859B|nr:hypothetical protein [Streptomyces sp. I05A-00742]
MGTRNVVEEFMGNVADDYKKAFDDLLGHDAGDDLTGAAGRLLAVAALAGLPRQLSAVGELLGRLAEELRTVEPLLAAVGGADSRATGPDAPGRRA